MDDTKTGRRTGTFSIAAAFAGTVIGAGFASGRELMQFFVVYGRAGLAGAGLSAAAMAALAAALMLRARRISGDDEEQPYGCLHRGRIMDGIMALLYFGILCVMLAGCDSLLQSGLYAPPFAGALFMAVAASATVSAGLAGILRFFKLAVPAVVCVMAIAGISALFGLARAGMPAQALPDVIPVGNWIWGSALYVSYNMLSSSAMLVPLGRAAAGGRRIVSGAFLGGALLGSLMMLMCVAMVRNYSLVAGHPLPLFFLACHVNPLLGSAYFAALLMGIYTASAGCLAGIVDRSGGIGTARRAWLAPAAAGMALAGSRLGFARLVSRLYPVCGCVGAAMLIGAAVEFIVRAVTMRKIRHRAGRRRGGLEQSQNDH